MKSLVAVLAASLACTLALAQPPPQLPKRYPWDQRPPKCLLLAPELAAGPMCAAPANWPDHAETKRHVDMLFIEHDFDLLERAEQELGYSREHFAAGEYLFDAWFFSLDMFFRGWGERGKQVAAAWATAKGTEGYALLAQALAVYYEGWTARGSGYSNTVMPEAWTIYRKKLSEADGLLERASPRLRAMGPWYLLKLRIAFESEQPKSRPMDLLKAGTQAWPDYLPLYSVAMNYVSPKWGGSFEQMEEIARYAAERTRKTHGESMYAMVYQRHLLLSSGGDYTLADTQADWERMKQAFRDLEATGKGPPWIAGAFAKLACQVRDRDEARRLYMVYDRRNPAAAAAEPSEPCRAFAMSSP